MRRPTQHENAEQIMDLRKREAEAEQRAIDDPSSLTEEDIDLLEPATVASLAHRGLLFEGFGVPAQARRSRLVSTTANRKQPFGRRHVPSAVPGSGPRDLSQAIASHRDRGGPVLTAAAADRATPPPGSKPQTVGTNPNPAARRLVSASDALTSGTPAASTQATSFAPCGGSY